MLALLLPLIAGCPPARVSQKVVFPNANQIIISDRVEGESARLRVEYRDARRIGPGRYEQEVIVHVDPNGLYRLTLERLPIAPPQDASGGPGSLNH